MKIELLKPECTPYRANETDAGQDLRANLDKPAEIQPGERKLIPAGIKMAIPEGAAGMVCSRSGLAAKHGIMVLNAPGIVDSSYRGEVGVVLINLGQEPFVVDPGMRIAQLVVAPVFLPALNVVPSLDETERGEGGFGSTGTA